MTHIPDEDYARVQRALQDALDAIHWARTELRLGRLSAARSVTAGALGVLNELCGSHPPGEGRGEIRLP